MKILTENWRHMTLVSLSNNYSPNAVYILGDLGFESSPPTVLPTHYVHLVSLQVTVTSDIPFWGILKHSGRPSWVQQSIKFWWISSLRYHSVFTNVVSLQEGWLSTLSPKIYLTSLFYFFSLESFKAWIYSPSFKLFSRLKILATLFYI